MKPYSRRESMCELKKVNCFDAIKIKNVDTKNNPDLEDKLKDNNKKIKKFILTNFPNWEINKIKANNYNGIENHSPVVSRMISSMKKLFIDQHNGSTIKSPLIRSMRTQESKKAKKIIISQSITQYPKINTISSTNKKINDKKNIIDPKTIRNHTIEAVKRENLINEDKNVLDDSLFDDLKLEKNLEAEKLEMNSNFNTINNDTSRNHNDHFRIDSINLNTDNTYDIMAIESPIGKYKFKNKLSRDINDLESQSKKIIYKKLIENSHNTIDTTSNIHPKNTSRTHNLSLFNSNFNNTKRDFTIKLKKINNNGKKIYKNMSDKIEAEYVPKCKNKISLNFDREIVKELNHKFLENKKKMFDEGIKLSPLKVRGFIYKIDQYKANIIKIADNVNKMADKTAYVLRDRINIAYENGKKYVSIDADEEFKNTYNLNLNENLSPKLNRNQDKLKKIHYTLDKKNKYLLNKIEKFKKVQKLGKTE